MKNAILIFIIFLLFFACSNDIEYSKIEVIKYNEGLVKEIKSNFDSTYTEYPKRSDFWTIDIYITDTTENRILKDSLGNIVAIVKTKDGVRYFTEEYYSNGQLKGKNNFPPGKIDGSVTYYYSDGRVKSIGQWKNSKQVGEWRRYNSDGKLMEIKIFDDNGIIISTKKYND